jgi:hypothetical protein
MARALWAGHIGSDFDGFLFAHIGEEKNGAILSVVSALARLDLDPWREAEHLASLPASRATERMASLIEALPDSSSAQRDPGTIAARLIELLPRPVSVGGAPRPTLLNADEVTQFRAGSCMFLCLILFMLAAQWMMTGAQPVAQAGDTATPIAGMASNPPHLNTGVSEK